MKLDIKKALPHILVVIGFILVALIYFSPALSGKRIYQNDIKLFEQMANQHRDYRAETGEETFWTNSAFGGMPTYQMGARFPNDIMDKLDRAIRFLPRPADYLFLYFISFYVLMLVMRVPWKLATVGALAFGFSTYLIIILGVGHNSKAHAVGYFPLVLAGIIMVFQKRYLWGFLLTAVAMGLHIQANHYQMTYYLGWLCIILGIAYFIHAIWKKELPHFLKSVGLLVVAVIMGIATNASTFLSTAEYAKTSVRGEQLLIDELEKDQVSDGLDYDYITQWSYGKLESINLISPKFMGVGTSADLGRDSAFVKELQSLGVPPEEIAYYAQTTRLYWGEQPFVEAPPYLGITVFVLAIFGIFFIKGRLRWWLIAGMVFSLVLSWGNNADAISRFFVNYVPLYNKFRAVSSIQVILELLLPITAIVGLHRFFTSEGTFDSKLIKMAVAVGGVVVVLTTLYLFSGAFFNLRPAQEAQMAIKQPEILNAIKEDRLTILRSDLMRSLIFTVLIGAVLWLTLKEKFSYNIAIIAIGVLIVFDLVGVDRRSVNEDSFITERQYQQNFNATASDTKMLEDDSYFRVIDLARGFSNPHTSYYFNSLNGYSAVQPRRVDDLYYKQIVEGNVEVLNMYNVKYILENTEEGMSMNRNPDANGPAWFVNEIQYVPDYNAEFAALEKVNTKQTVLIRNEYREEIGNTFQPQKDSLSVVQTKEVLPNKLVYKVSNNKDGFLVFAENYYEHGWKATIDGEETKIYAVDYSLRGIKVPAGTHDVVMTFDPQVVKTGGAIMLGSSVLLFLLVAGGVFYTFKNNKEEEAQES